MSPPFFSICIPNYSRTSFLLQALDSLAAQDFRDFEICISDDVSPDNRQREIEAWLETSGLRYRMVRQTVNLRYDANLRAAIGLASGKYCFLLGNDDALKTKSVLTQLHRAIEAEPNCGAVVTDFEDFTSGQLAGRIRQTGSRGSGPEVAARAYRQFSFVSGIVLLCEPAQRYATSRWDGGEMYQTYLASSIIASGHSLLELAWPAIRKDIHIAGESVDSYAKRQRAPRWPIHPVCLPLAQFARIAADGIALHEPDVPSRLRLNEIIVRQLLLFTYPFWLFEYRNVQSWSYAAGVALGMRPGVITCGIELAVLARWRLRLLYVLVTLAGLLIPAACFKALRLHLYRLAKS